MLENMHPSFKLFFVVFLLSFALFGKEYLIHSCLLACVSFAWYLYRLYLEDQEALEVMRDALQ